MSLFDKRYPEANNIIVGTISDAKNNHHQYNAIISIEDIGYKNGVRFSPATKNHLLLNFDDIEHENNVSSVKNEHIKQAILFSEMHKNDLLFIHCHAGQCRSPAIALTIIAHRMGPGREQDAVESLKIVRRWSTPNKLVIQKADKILNRNGKLIEALNLKGNNFLNIGNKINLLKSV